jgi:hypothetical protein
MFYGCVSLCISVVVFFFCRLLCRLYDKITQICAQIRSLCLSRFIGYFSTKFINLGKYTTNIFPASHKAAEIKKEKEKLK